LDNNGTINIDFNKPAITGNELAYIRQAYENSHISGDGFFTRQAQNLLEKELGAARVLLTSSCTHALEMAALLLDIRPGDEVIVPSFTFVSTINAFVLRGARPVFIDIREDTLNMDEKLLEKKITEQTRVLLPVHYAGVGCDMSSIMTTAHHHGLSVVEDNAHGLFGQYRGQFLGTFGAMATQSFHETKNISCGEGGALLINDPVLIERAEIIREKGTNRSRFFRGMVDKYTWVDIGSSYLCSDLLAAVLLAQLEQRRQIQQARKAIWNHYQDGLESWAAEQGVRLPVIPPDCEQAYHMFYLLMPSLEMRQALISHLKSVGIISVFHYLPLHLSDMGQRFGGQVGDCPVTESVSDRLLRLPFYNTLQPDEVETVISAVIAFQCS